MFERVLDLLISGSAAMVGTIVLATALWRWPLVLRMEIGWVRRGWSRAPAVLAMFAQSALHRGPRYERVKLALMIGLLAVLVPLYWLAFADALFGLGLKWVHGGAVAGGEKQLWLSLAASLSLVVAASVQLLMARRRRGKTEAVLASYVAEGDRVLGGGMGEVSSADLSALTFAVQGAWAGLLAVGTLGVCVALCWNFG